MPARCPRPLPARTIRRGRFHLLAAAAVALAAGGCARSPGLLEPAGPKAFTNNGLWWTMFVIAGVIFVLVVAYMLLALIRGRGARVREGEPLPEPMLHNNDRLGLAWVIGGGIIMPIIVLTFLAVLTVRAMVANSEPETPGLQIQVTARQFWWEVRYPGTTVVTANEIHIPTGETIHILLSSPDVIHSFWVPQLSGKTDVVPGQTNVTWLETSQAGTYRGQCAEYCGPQHAHMAFFVVAQPPAQFNAWLQGQNQPAAAPPRGQLASVGAQDFARLGCIACHAIRSGGPEHIGGRVGPDLTHVASRATIAAGTLPNTPANMAHWIADPQGVKPGSYMPNIPMTQQDVQALVAYLDALH